MALEYVTICVSIGWSTDVVIGLCRSVAERLHPLFVRFAPPATRCCCRPYGYGDGRLVAGRLPKLLRPLVDRKLVGNGHTSPLHELQLTQYAMEGEARALHSHNALLQQVGTAQRAQPDKQQTGNAAQ